MTNSSAIFVLGVFSEPHNSQLIGAVKKRGYSYSLGKRTIDILFSSLICIFILSWLLPILAVLIKLDSKGPVFFRQKRTGFRGKIFKCFKLRTMKMNYNSEDLQASLNDPRITRIGTFLRISNLDELPQFINVLIGDMSIVGPRPHMIKDSNDFSTIFPSYYNQIGRAHV